MITLIDVHSSVKYVIANLLQRTMVEIQNSKISKQLPIYCSQSVINKGEMLIN